MANIKGGQRECVYNVERKGIYLNVSSRYSARWFDSCKVPGGWMCMMEMGGEFRSTQNTQPVVMVTRILAHIFLYVPIHL